MYCLLQGGDVDYNSGPYDVIIPAGHVISSFNISIIDDSILEQQSEKFYLIIDPSSLFNGVFAGNPNRTVVNIFDNDGKYMYTKPLLFQSII